MNPDLAQLKPYPFERLRALFARRRAAENRYPAISLSIGEPKHSTPEFIKKALTENLGGLASYPLTAGSQSLREAIASWLVRRYALHEHRSRQAKYCRSTARARRCSRSRRRSSTARAATRECSCPILSIRSTRAPHCSPARDPFTRTARAHTGFAIDYEAIPAGVWSRVQLAYACSPANPTGHVMTLEEWRRLFSLSDRYGFVIASDECYSEIYFDEAHPPLGALEAAQRLGRSGFPRLIVFSSLSKRSNVPGMRAGFAAGNAEL